MAKKVPFDLHPDEEPIRIEHGAFVKGKVNAQLGRLVLTNQRLVFFKHPNPILGTMFGAIGALIAASSKRFKAKVAVEIPLTAIERWENEKQGLNKKAIRVHQKDGESVKFTFSKAYDQWDADLRKALAGGETVSDLTKEA